MRRISTAASLAFFAIAAFYSTAASAQSRWFWQNPRPQGSSLSAVATLAPGIAVAVGEGGSILRTSDGGATWEFEESGTTAWLEGVAFVNANVGLAVGGGILRTTDGGFTWTAQTATFLHLRGVSFGDASTATAVGDGGRILRTTDGGITWTPQDSGTFSQLFAVSFVDANTGWAVGFPTYPGPTIIHTTDGGATWKPQEYDSLLYGVSFVDANMGWAVGDLGKILRTTDGGANWIPDVNPMPDRLNGISFASADTGTAVGWRGTILRTNTRRPITPSVTRALRGAH